jgi:hypothetical protein
MHRFIALCVSLSLPVVLVAQDKTTTSPPGMESKEGDSSARFFGSFADAHFQFIDGEFKGKGAKTIKRVGYRHDWDRHATGQVSPKRSWPKIAMRIADGDFDKVSLTFSTNPQSRSTLVFGPATVVFPEQKGAPGPGSTGPAPFNQALSFPFGSLWAYSSKHDILLDFVFSGAGGGGDYYLDSANYAGFTRSSSTVLPSTFFSGCRDSSSSMSPSSQVSVNVITYAQSTGSPATSNQVFLFTRSFYTAPQALVVHAIAAKGFRAGTFFPGVQCNKLHVDLNPPTLLLFGNTDKNGASGSMRAANFGHQPSLVGTELYAQAAWSDSLSSRLLLSLGAVTTIPAQPINPPRRMVLYRKDATSLTAEGIANNDEWNPIAEYTYR